MAHLNGAPGYDTEPWAMPTPVHVLIFASLGVLTTLGALQLWSAMATAEQPLLWFAGRALGFLAYVALWLSMLFGSLVSSGGGGGVFSKKWVMDLHQEWTLAAVIATVLHIVVLVTHPDSHVSAWTAVVPFIAPKLGVEIGIGTISFLGLMIVTLSSWLRTYVPYGAWRSIHATSFGVMMLALAHSIAAGTDTGTWAASGLYVLTTASLTAVMVLRIGVALGKPRAA